METASYGAKKFTKIVFHRRPVRRALCFELLHVHRGSLAKFKSRRGKGTLSPGSLLPYCFSGRHLLELMVDFATDRTKKLVEFVFDW
jgi:hypothetical protein